MIYFTEHDSRLGLILLTSDGERLTGLYFADETRRPRVETSGRRESRLSVFEATRCELTEYFLAGRRTFDLDLAPAGTPFDRSVWSEIAQIPYGSTLSYGALAERIGHSSATRAVGAATGRNPIAIVIPCHRVVGTNGRLTGYAGGLDRKRALLAIEDARPCCSA
jgi:methylated-DNA-[protein]-cysteine S-methyltransferase